MKYYEDAAGNIRRFIDTELGPVDADTGKRLGEGAVELWTSAEAAEAWDVSVKYVRLILPKVPGARRHVNGPNVLILIPAKSPNPTGGKPGRKPHTAPPSID